MFNLAGTKVLLVFAALTALGPLATDMYLPAMPAIASSFGATAGETQLTLSAYMFGFSITQIGCGPLADRFGRKPVVIIGLALFAIASVICAVAPNIGTLLAGRFLQAVGGATGPVLGRAMVRDIYDPASAARVLAYMASAMALAPALAPSFGGVMLSLANWESIFLLLALYAAVLLALISRKLPEPLDARMRQPINGRAIISNFSKVLRDRNFLGYSLINAAAFSGLFAFLSGSSFVLIDFLEVSPTIYAAYFPLLAGGFLAGTLLTARFSHVAPSGLIQTGVGMCTVSGSVMAALAWAGIYTVPAVIVPHILFMLGVGLLMPQTMAFAISPFPECAGSASSLFGFIQMTSAALIGAAVGQLHDGTTRTMATAIALTGVIALISYVGLIRSRRNRA